ncbi:uncharacterized protein RJT20DRAFT_144082 [Scheffersomyces xylosifermentans]|uniref:uncharacterized protein n=1 Tax=Scheffersomyces xylosifermentans TaxID=1304137 RepID=UPI00315CB4B3
MFRKSRPLLQSAIFPLKAFRSRSYANSTTKLLDLNPPKYCSEEEMGLAIQEIRKLGVRVLNTAVEIEHHTKNEFTPHLPLAHEKPKYVIYPDSTEEVSQIMRILHQFSVPVVPFSGGTSLEGHFYSTRQGVVLDTSKMNKILEVNYDDLDARVQAGVNWQDLNKYLEPAGVMLGTDCGPNGLISGMINTNASGINASRYGAMIANVISITVVLADGTIIKTKQRPRKSSAGYNLTGLFVGSEGTLGIVTEATVKLHVSPKYETVVVAQFPTIQSSTDTVAQLFRAGLQPNAIELMDKDMMKCLNYSGYCTREWLECPTIFFKIGGLNKIVVEEYVKQLRLVTDANECQAFIFAENEEEQKELFDARKNAFYAMIQYGRNEIDEDVRIWVTDIAVPLSRLSPVLTEIHDLIKGSGFESIILAHAADGNFHADLFYKIEDKLKAEAVINKMVKLGLDNEGTCTGEHGVGNAKRNFLQLELGEDAIDLMRKLKLALDPKRILNPDKIFKIDPNDKGQY